MKCRFGEIWYVSKIPSIGSEPRGNCPAVIVSNDKNNSHSKVVTVAYIKAKTPSLPTHVELTSHDGLENSIVCCEALDSISVDRLERCIGNITQYEHARIQMAIKIALNIFKEEHKNER